MRRTTLPLVCLITLSSLVAKAGPARLPVDEIVKLSGESLIKAADAALDNRAPLPFDDLLRILDSLKPIASSEDQAASTVAMEVYEKVFRTACAVGGQEKLEALVATFAAAPLTPFHRRELLFDLAPLWLERELQQLESEKPNPIVPNTNGVSLPDEYRNVAQDARSIWQQFSSLMSPYRSQYDRGPGKPWISYIENYDVFRQDADSILVGKTKPALPRMAQFESSGCTGHEELYDPQSLLVFMALLRERRLPEAVGAVIQLPRQRGATGERWPQGSQIAIRFLKLCGLDWQDVFCGGIIQGARSFRSLDFGNALAVDGGDRIARTLAHALLATNSREEEIVRTLAYMMQPPRSPDPDSDETKSGMPFREGDEVPPRHAAALSEKTREEIIEVFAAWASPNADGYALNAAIPYVASQVRPSTTAALRRMLEHHSPNIVHKATEALIARGESVPKAGPVPPITIKLMLGGRPVSNAPIEVALQAGKFSRKIHLKSDEQGNITIPGEDFARKHSPVTAVVFETDMGFNDERKLDDPSFQLTVPVRPNHPPPSPIIIPAQPVTLGLILPQIAGANPNAAIHLRVEGKPASTAGSDSVRTDFHLPRKPQYFIPALQEGTYTFTVHTDGVATWVSEPVVVKGFAKTIKAIVSEGHEVRARIELPKGAYLWPGTMRLLNGKGLVADQPIFDYEKKEAICVSLAPGIYTLSIRSSAEQNEEMFEGAVSNEILLKPREVAEWKSATKRFEVTENSPGTIDLGTIRIEALPRSSR